MNSDDNIVAGTKRNAAQSDEAGPDQSYTCVGNALGTCCLLALSRSCVGCISTSGALLQAKMINRTC
jgi:hypothetical protein